MSQLFYLFVRKKKLHEMSIFFSNKSNTNERIELKFTPQHPCGQKGVLGFFSGVGLVEGLKALRRS